MADIIVESLYQEQKKTKPKIEDAIPEYLEGNLRKTAQDFVAYLRENKMKPSWMLTNSWKVNYKNKCICQMRIWADKINHFGPPGTSWVITPYLDYVDRYKAQIMDEGLQNTIWNNVFYCVHNSGRGGKGCNPIKSCASGRSVMLFGKELKGICCTRPLIWFFDPDEMAIDCIKRLLVFEQNARDELN